MTVAGTSTATRVTAALAWLEAHGSKKDRDGMARYGIVATRVFGISVGALRDYAKKELGKNHDLSQALWKTGWYEARLLAAFVGDPARLTSAQMDKWCRDFENWGDCDTVCFVLFDKSPLAWGRIKAWSTRKAEFEKRAAFALLASVAGHDKKALDAPFLKSLPLIERAATDDRNFVKKGVSWALRGVGHRNKALHSAAVKLAQRLAASSNAAARWVGKDALRDLERPMVKKKVAGR